jgi:hypothetical protein
MCTYFIKRKHIYIVTDFSGFGVAELLEIKG